MIAGALVLLVTDIVDHATSYVATLTKGALRVHWATSGGEALAAVATLAPDCGVIDLRLPDMTGWELCRQMRRREDCRAMPLVVLTPDVHRGAAEESARAGCNAWLAHPSVAEDLLRTVRHVLEARQGEPPSGDDAVLTTLCPACGSDRVRAALRVSPVQYYVCRGCGFYWRVDVLASRS